MDIHPLDFTQDGNGINLIADNDNVLTVLPKAYLITIFE